MKFKTVGLALVVAGSLLGCAKPPEDVGTSYISPITYKHYSCRQIQAESIRVGRRVAIVTGQQQDEATEDAVAMGVFLFLFWPAIFFVGGSDHEAQLAHLKGEYEALQQASIERKCGFEEADKGLFGTARRGEEASAEAGVRWIGQGFAQCGRPWSIDLTANARDVTGELSFGNIDYDLTGTMGQDDKTDRLVGTKNEYSKHRIGPRFIKLRLEFTREGAKGDLAIDGANQDSCLSPIALEPLNLPPAETPKTKTERLAAAAPYDGKWVGKASRVFGSSCAKTYDLTIDVANYDLKGSMVDGGDKFVMDGEVEKDGELRDVEAHGKSRVTFTGNVNETAMIGRWSMSQGDGGGNGAREPCRGNFRLTKRAGGLVPG